ncbi:MAG TPA: hypothetical protein VFM90_00745, partial [Cyclobacteriaceae bacterium]|nr:hypothetical protein [Cyclobacteriaceae bacterium]
MGKVNIKIRHKPITADSLEKYRNYPALLKKYKRDKQFKRAVRIFLYSLALTAFVLLLVFISMWKLMLDKRQETINPEKAFQYLQTGPGNKTDTVLLELVIKTQNDSMYQIMYKGSRFISYEFPVDSSYNSFTDCKLLALKIFEIDNKSYTVKKYLKDDPKFLDDQVYYFYSPDFGVLQIQSMMWS